MKNVLGLPWSNIQLLFSFVIINFLFPVKLHDYVLHTKALGYGAWGNEGFIDGAEFGF